MVSHDTVIFDHQNSRPTVLFFTRFEPRRLWCKSLSLEVGSRCSSEFACRVVCRYERNHLCRCLQTLWARKTQTMMPFNKLDAMAHQLLCSQILDLQIWNRIVKNTINLFSRISSAANTITQSTVQSVHFLQVIWKQKKPNSKNILWSRSTSTLQEEQRELHRSWETLVLSLRCVNERVSHQNALPTQCHIRCCWSAEAVSDRLRSEINWWSGDSILPKKGR